MAHPTKLVLDGTENIQLINETGGNQLTTTQSIADLGGGGGERIIDINGCYYLNTTADHYIPFAGENESTASASRNTRYMLMTDIDEIRIFMAYGGSGPPASGNCDFSVCEQQTSSSSQYDIVQTVNVDVTDFVTMPGATSFKYIDVTWTGLNLVAGQSIAILLHNNTFSAGPFNTFFTLELK